MATTSGVPLLSPPELALQAIPYLPVDGGRLHLWGTGSLGTPDPFVWNGIGIRVAIEGPGQVTAGGGLNVTSPVSARRWETGSDFDPTGSPARWNFISVTRAGLQLPARNDGWDNGLDAVYLGYIDLAGNGGYSQIFLSEDDAGISRQGGSPTEDHVYFGWGNEPRDFPPYWLPDAVIVPEPASALLLAASGLVLARRRTRQPGAYKRRAGIACTP
ncbi:MAG: PEP-CTERM sorting domain-containing protein [Phycisphaerales bacterium]|nr:PEP-CTERM sorting domain-containing protein [Phycisphaerales bacterium]